MYKIYILNEFNMLNKLIFRQRAKLKNFICYFCNDIIIKTKTYVNQNRILPIINCYSFFL